MIQIAKMKILNKTIYHLDFMIIQVILKINRLDHLYKKVKENNRFISPPLE